MLEIEIEIHKKIVFILIVWFNSHNKVAGKSNDLTWQETAYNRSRDQGFDSSRLLLDWDYWSLPVTEITTTFPEFNEILTQLKLPTASIQLNLLKNTITNGVSNRHAATAVKTTFCSLIDSVNYV